MVNLYQPNKIGQWGLIEGGDTEYFAFPAVNASRLKLWVKSEKTFEANPDIKSTDAMRFGTAFHTLLLESKRFEQTYKVFEKPLPDSNMNKTENKLALAEFKKSGFIHLTPEDKSDLIGMKDSLLSNPAASKLMSASGETEQGFWFIHDSGIVCKVKPDKLAMLKNENVMVADLKKAMDASPDGFKKASQKYDYPLQDALYTIGVQTRFPDKNVMPFHFFAVENKAPYLQQHHIIDDWQREYMQTWVSNTLFDIADKIKNDIQLKGYNDFSDPNTNYGLNTIELDDWYLSRFINN